MDRFSWKITCETISSNKVHAAYEALEPSSDVEDCHYFGLTRLASRRRTGKYGVRQEAVLDTFIMKDHGAKRTGCVRFMETIRLEFRDTSVNPTRSRMRHSSFCSRSQFILHNIDRVTGQSLMQSFYAFCPWKRRRTSSRRYLELLAGPIVTRRMKGVYASDAEVWHQRWTLPALSHRSLDLYNRSRC